MSSGGGTRTHDDDPVAGTSGDPTPAGGVRTKLIAAPALLAVGCLLIVTLVPPSATRVFSWPWSVLYAIALAGPACSLLARAVESGRPGRWPKASWHIAALSFACVVVGSALASPFRQSSLLWAAPYLAAVAVFFVIVDWLRGAGNERRAVEIAHLCLAIMFVLVAVTSLVQWLAPLGRLSLGYLIEARNPYPLGHANYTGGIGVLTVPIGAGLVLQRRRRARGANGTNDDVPTVTIGVTTLGIVTLLLGLALVFSSGSRGAIIALGALAIGGLLAAPVATRRKLGWAVGLLVIAAVLIATNPRTRAMFRAAPPDAAPNVSNVQRSAMLQAGWRMGIDRPLLGWGPGTTPLAFPRYRAQLAGGAEDVLELHCLPVQIWAELGGAGILCGLAVLILTWRAARSQPATALTLTGYAVFALFDAQLDVPIFGFTVAVLLACIAAGDDSTARDSSVRRTVTALVTAAAFALTVLLGRNDPTPAWNTEALQVAAQDPARAIALLERSLARNPDQEIAHFNLGWLLVVKDPAAAAKHFRAAAHLVPDKGGVYFGLGLARLNGNDRAGAAAAFAIEMINDPLFQLSPWWQNPALAPLLPTTLEYVQRFDASLESTLPEQSWVQRELRYTIALQRWLAGRASADDVAAAANTARRREYFASQPAPEALRGRPAREIHRERVGYPVLMRNLDLPPPVDAWAIRESTAGEGDLAALWPEKGWVPGPSLIALLRQTESTNN